MFFTRSCLIKKTSLDILLVIRPRIRWLSNVNWIMKRKSSSYFGREYKRPKREMASNNNTNKPAQRPDHTPTNKIKEVDGNLFSCPKTHSMAHCISADVKMGKGIAVLFKEEFGGVQNLIDQRQKSGGLALLQKGERYIYYLVTKAVYSHKPTYETLYQSLEKMKEHNLKYGVKNVSMPRIGCGLDKLDWNEVSDMINKIYRDTDIEITVYNYRDNNKHGKGKGKQGKSDQPGQSNEGRNSRNYQQNHFSGQGRSFYYSQKDVERNSQASSRAQEERASERRELHQSVDSIPGLGNVKKQKRKPSKKSDNTESVKINREYDARKEMDSGYFNPMIQMYVDGQDDKEDRNDKDGSQDHKGKGEHSKGSRDRKKNDEKRENQSEKRSKDGTSEKKRDGDHHRKKEDETQDRSNNFNEHKKDVEKRAADQLQKEEKSEERSKHGSQIAEHERDGDGQVETNKKESEKFDRKQAHTENDGSVSHDTSEKERHEDQIKMNDEEHEHGEDSKASDVHEESQSECRKAEDASPFSDDSDEEETIPEPGGGKGEAKNREEEKKRKKKEKKKRQKQNKKERLAAQGK